MCTAVVSPAELGRNLPLMKTLIEVVASWWLPDILAR
jgi:hypothetical protein